MTDTVVPRETTPWDDRPEVLAWVRERLGCEVDWCDRMLQQAGEDPKVAEMARTIRWYRERIVTNLIGGEGCIVALFDSRRPWLNEHAEPYDPERHGGGR